ncbi:Gfo/Idh/MocA family protein [Bacillus sp. Marseille-Q3570]|uniref:Gfo/Idh/MocA family protein n=1 Tax=Bacillus sp. Marseille-Q3570 TaxID=2963522 RepID=UPI0021B736D1|nr:Gfo/Idh/MocA family oxidoreductase [Bacillus sp. Marseille-Q3570]
MNNKPLGVGIIGCGEVARAHLTGYNKLKDRCVVRAVSDVDTETAFDFARSCPSEMEVYTDMHLLLERNDIDIVSICTPPYLHKSHVLKAIRHGKHVLCEKPFVPTLADCDEVLFAAEGTDRKIGIAMQLRYNPEFLNMKQLIQDGFLGQIYFAEMRGLYWRGDNYFKKSWRGTWDKGCGGVLMNQGIHILDLFLEILGPVKCVDANMETVKHTTEVEDHIRATIWFDNGTRGEMLCSLNVADPEISMCFSGQNKILKFPFKAGEIQESPNGFPVQIDNENVTGDADHLESDPIYEHHALIEDFVSSVQDNREPSINGVEARKSLEVITAIYKSAIIGRKVELPIRKNDIWYSSLGQIKE